MKASSGKFFNPSNAKATFIQWTRTQIFFENHLNPIILVCIGKLSSSTFRWVPICQGFGHFSAFFTLFCIDQISHWGEMFITTLLKINLPTNMYHYLLYLADYFQKCHALENFVIGPICSECTAGIQVWLQYVTAHLNAAQFHGSFMSACLYQSQLKRAAIPSHGQAMNRQSLAYFLNWPASTLMLTTAKTVWQIR